MRHLFAILAASTLAAASPLAAAIQCGNSCWGSASATCPTPPPCPAGAIKVTGGGAPAIQAAINAAAAGKVICVAPGTYKGNLNFHGKAVTVKSSTPLGAILMGAAGGGPVVTFDSNESAASVLDGFEITGGASGTGGGIEIVNASPVIQNCLIKNNAATASSANTHPRGGGVYVSGLAATPAILCSCLEGNRSDYAGGGLSSTYLARPYLDFVSFAGNAASYGGAYSAGFSGMANIENSEFVDNTAAGDGGAIHVLTEFGSTLVRRSVLAQNQASGNGGAVWVPAGFATILNAVFDGNTAANGGAAAAGFDGVLTVESSILVNNDTTGPGSATLVVGAAEPPGSTLVDNFNLFFNNTGPDSSGTTGNAGNLDADPLFARGTCYMPVAASPTRHAGLPDIHFNNAPPFAGRNNLGIYGGPTTP